MKTKLMEIRLEPERLKPVLVQFAACCSCEYEGGTCHGSGLHNGSRELFFEPWQWWAHDYMTTRDMELWEGCAWIDKTEMDEMNLCHYAISGPMVGVTVPEGKVSSWNEIKDVDPSRPFMGAHGLDCLSIPDFMRMWKSAGAKVGFIHNGKFEEA